MSRDNVIIISGFPGVGKSHLKKALPEGIVADSDSSLFNKEHFPSNYIKHIKFLIEETNVRFILVSSHEEVREALMEAGLNFVLVTPTSDQKEAYLDRYRERGSPLSFISLMEDKWDEFLGSCVAEQQVTLLPDSYLLDTYTEIYRQRQPIYRDQSPYGQNPYLPEKAKSLGDYEAANKVEFSTWLESLKKNERLYIHKHSNEKIYLEKDGFLLSGDVYVLVQNRKFLVCEAPNEEISHYAYLLLDSSSGEAYPLLTEEVVVEPRLFQRLNANTKENYSFITVVGNEFKAWLEDLVEGEAVHVRVGGVDQETTSDRFEVNDSLWGVVGVDGFYIGVPKEPMEHPYYLFDPDSPQAFPIFKKKVSEVKAPEIDGFESADLVEFAKWINELEENECIAIVDALGEFHVIGKYNFTVNGRFWCISGFPNFYICVPEEPMECLYYACDVITGQKFPLLKNIIKGD